MATVSCGGTSERYRFIKKLGQQLGVKRLCLWLNVSPSGFYDWQNRKPSLRKLKDAELKIEIRNIYDDNEGRYGSPRIFETLKQNGHSVSQKRVARLMQELNLVARVMKVTRRSVGNKRFAKAGENLRLGSLPPVDINQVWVADVTYLKVQGKWHYLSVIMDLYSRRIVSWSLDIERTAEVTKRTLLAAIRTRKPDFGLILHTDRGVEYRGGVYQKELNRYGMRHSLNRLGYCTDNAHMESFFHSLKAELIRGRVFKDAMELRYALGGYINKYYNTRRLHSGISYNSPIKYEQLTA